jgi:hypothetical protein
MSDQLNAGGAATLEKLHSTLQHLDKTPGVSSGAWSRCSAACLGHSLVLRAAGAVLELEEALAKRDREIDALRVDREALTSSSAGHAAEAERLRTEAESARQALAELERTVRDVRGQIRAKDDETAALRRAIMALKKAGGLRSWERALTSGHRTWSRRRRLRWNVRRSMRRAEQWAASRSRLAVWKRLPSACRCTLAFSLPATINLWLTCLCLCV